MYLITQNGVTFQARLNAILKNLDRDLEHGLTMAEAEERLKSTLARILSNSVLTKTKTGV